MIQHQEHCDGEMSLQESPSSAGFPTEITDSSASSMGKKFGKCSN